MQGQRNLNVRNVERNIMDRVVYGVTHHPTKIYRKEAEKEQLIGGSWEQWPEQSWSEETDTARGVTMIGALQIRILRLQQPKNFNMRLGLSKKKKTNLFNMTDWILHNELSHLVLLKPQHAKLWFLPTLQQVGIWSTKIHYLDVRTALQAETKCMIKGGVFAQMCVTPMRGVATSE